MDLLPIVGTGPRAGATVTISADVHPERSAHVRLDAFDGPLALLLALIEQRELDVLDVPLGELAGAYLEAIARLEAPALPHISSFITVASQLILIKSRALLPRPPSAAVLGPEEGFDPEAALRERLLLYRRYRDASQRLAERLSAGAWLFHREAAAATAAGLAGARPPEGPPLDPLMLVRALDSAMHLSPPPEPPPEVIPRSVTLEERAEIIRQALREAPDVVLQDLLRDVRDRVVVAVTFLAMLELVKGREVAIEQREPWGPIHCRVLTPEPAVAS